MARIGRRGAPWMVNRRFVELEAAQAWHISPDEWDSKSEDSRAEMMAVVQVRAQMQSYEEYQQELKRATK